MVDTLEGDVGLKTLSKWKLGRTAECKLVLKKQEKQLPTQMAKGVIVGILSFSGNTPPLIMA